MTDEVYGVEGSELVMFSEDRQEKETSECGEVRWVSK